MSSRKRDRADGVTKPLTSPSSQTVSVPPSINGEHQKTVPFTVVIWNDIDVVLFGRLMDLVRSCLVQVLMDFSKVDKAVNVAHIRELREKLHVSWRAHLGSSTVDLSGYDSAVSDGIDNLCCQLEQLTRTYDDSLALCKQFIRIMEDCGFLEEDGGPLGVCLATIKFSAYSNGYAYSERASLSFPLPKIDGEKARSGDADHNGPERVGYAVNLQDSPSLDPVINTSILLIEPRKRRPPLDEYRIFSHPRKTTTHGVEDLIVDEELYIRSLHVLSHHLDTFGSLQGLSPYVRFTVYNMFSKAPAVFDSLIGLPSASESSSKQMQNLRAVAFSKRNSFESTRRSLREGAQRVGWFAVSAQWRDQVLFALHDAEEADWYSIADTLLRGGLSNFPNFSYCTMITDFMVAIIKRRLDPSLSFAVDTIQMCLVPLLQGRSVKDFYSSASSDGCISEECLRHVHRIACSTLERDLPFSLDNKEEDLTKHCKDCIAESLSVVVPSMVIPLQRILELLELCSSALESASGAEGFIKAFLAAEWDSEEEVLQFLIATEPTNLHLASLVAVPKVRQEVITNAIALQSDYTFALAVSAKCILSSTALPNSDIQEKKYWYWKVLSTCLQDADRHDDLFFLYTSNHGNVDLQTSERPFYESCLERASRVWPQEMAKLIDEEEKYRRKGCSGTQRAA